MQNASATRAAHGVRISFAFIAFFALVAPTRAEPLKECGDPAANLKQGIVDIAGLNKILAGCGEFLKVEPNNPYAYFNIALAFDAGGDNDRALPYYDKAIALKPDFARAYNYRGNLYNRKDDFAHALADQTKAIEIEPGDYRNYSSRFDANHNTGNYTAALADITKAIELSPKEDYLLFFNRGDLQEKLGNKEAAIADYKKAAALAGTSFPPVTNALQRLGVQ